MNAYHVCGGLFALWALVVTFLGVTREGFPGTPSAERAVAAISVLLCVGTIGTAIYTSATAEHGGDEQHGGEEQALLSRI